MSITIKDISASVELAIKVQQLLINLKLLSGAPDGKVGIQTIAAFAQLLKILEIPQFTEELLQIKSLPQPQLNLTKNDFAARICQYMLTANYWIDKENFNIIYVEGCDLDGTPNADRMDEWNDVRLLLGINNQVPQVIKAWKATTEPGWKYTENPLNPAGAFRIAFGQYKGWTVGMHKNQEALVQVGEIAGYRDRNQDGKRTGDRIFKGSDFGVNQHHGGNSEKVGGWSAGCLVGQTVQGHKEFMKIVKTHTCYQSNINYVFLTTITPGDALLS